MVISSYYGSCSGPWRNSHVCKAATFWSKQLRVTPLEEHKCATEKDRCNEREMDGDDGPELPDGCEPDDGYGMGSGAVVDGTGAALMPPEAAPADATVSTSVRTVMPVVLPTVAAPNFSPLRVMTTAVLAAMLTTAVVMTMDVE